MYLTEAARRRGHRRGKHSVPEVAFGDTRLSVWEERDRAHVELINAKNDATIIEWWDDDVRQAIEDGFLKPGKLHETAYDYAIHVGLIKRPQHARENPVEQTQDGWEVSRIGSDGRMRSIVFVDQGRAVAFANKNPGSTIKRVEIEFKQGRIVTRENPAHAHPGSYLPINIGDKRTFDAHGQKFEVKYHSRNTYVLNTVPPGQRRRWGNRDQIQQDIAHVLENGSLPPAGRSQAFENPSEIPQPHKTVLPWGGQGWVVNLDFIHQGLRAYGTTKKQAVDGAKRDYNEWKARGFQWVTPSLRENPVEARDFDTIDDALARAHRELGATHYVRTQGNVGPNGEKVTVYAKTNGHWDTASLSFARGFYHWPAVFERTVKTLPREAKPLVRGRETQEAGCEHCACEHCGAQENPVEVSDGIPWVKSERNAEDFEEVRAVAEKIGEIKGARDIYDLMSPWTARQDKEHLCVILLDIHSMLRGVSVVHIGTRDRVTVDPADVLKPAIDRGAKGLAIIHNHPTGSADHSPADASLTKAIKKACDVNDITFIDHVVLGTNEYYSFADKKLTKVRKR